MYEQTVTSNYKTATGAQEVAGSSLITGECDVMVANVDRLFEGTELLEQRLHMVLRGPEPRPAPTDKAGSSCELASRLYTINVRLNELNMRIREIESRVAV